MRTDRSTILSSSLRPLLPTAFLFSFYLLFAGHNAPGGGFIGGLVAGAGLVLRQIDQGPESAARMLRVQPRSLLSAGLALTILTGTAPWIAGRQLLESAKFEVALPVVGTVKATSALLFDFGIYLIVVGMTASILATLGSRESE